MAMRYTMPRAQSVPVAVLQAPPNPTQPPGER
jgi:hypothetical protein